MHKITIAIIHDYNDIRLESIRNLVDSASSALSNSNLVRKVEYSWQPPISPIAKKIGLFRELINFNLSREWREYIGISKDSLIIHMIRLAMLIIRFTPTTEILKKSSIEIAITSKHVRAWENFLELGDDWLWIMEDDACLISNSIDRINLELKSILKENSSSPIYIDIAGGITLSPKVMKINYLFTSKKIEFERPITNTACSYLVNRSLCEYLVDSVTYKPYLKYLPVDLLLNMLFINLFKVGIKIKCTHFEPPILEHGSVTGRFNKWRK